MAIVIAHIGKLNDPNEMCCRSCFFTSPAAIAASWLRSLGAVKLPQKKGAHVQLLILVRKRQDMCPTAAVSDPFFFSYMRPPCTQILLRPFRSTQRFVLYKVYRGQEECTMSTSFLSKIRIDPRSSCSLTGRPVVQARKPHTPRHMPTSAALRNLCLKSPLPSRAPLAGRENVAADCAVQPGSWLSFRAKTGNRKRFPLETDLCFCSTRYRYLSRKPIFHQQNNSASYLARVLYT